MTLQALAESLGFEMEILKGKGWNESTQFKLSLGYRLIFQADYSRTFAFLHGYQTALRRQRSLPFANAKI